MEFMCFLVGALLGAVGAAAAVLVMVRLGLAPGPVSELLRGRGAPAGDGLSQALLDDLRDVAPGLAQRFAEPPAVPVESVPATVTTAQVNALQAASTLEDATALALKYVRDDDVARVVALLARWRPRRARAGVELTEREYEERLARVLRTEGFADQIDRQRRVGWRGDNPSGTERMAVPDFVLRNRVLVELKADLVRSDQVDRAMGQMLRYLLAWRDKGVAVLAVCGNVPPEMRFLIRTYIESWRTTLQTPVTVIFRKTDSEADVAVEFAKRDDRAADTIPDPR